MNLDLIRQQNADNEAVLQAAQAEYLAARATMARKIGLHLKALRESSGLNAAMMGRFLGVKTPRNYCYQLEDGIKEKDGTVRYYSVETLLAAVPKYEEVIRLTAGLAAEHVAAVAYYTHAKAQQTNDTP